VFMAGGKITGTGYQATFKPERRAA
jgi:hypothetical protein